MRSGSRNWGTALAIYILMIVTLQLTISIVAPKERYRGCTGWKTVGFAGTERRYIHSYYLNRTEDGFTLATEADFIASITSASESPVNICIADVDWYERTSLFDRYSLLSFADTSRKILRFTAREGSMGSYTPIDPYEHSALQMCIWRSANHPGFIQGGLVSIAIPKVDPLNLAFKLLIHAILIYLSIRWSPGFSKTIHWIFTSFPRTNTGHCVHCEYPTIGLTTPICPECGQPHGSTTQITA